MFVQIYNYFLITQITIQFFFSFNSMKVKVPENISDITLEQYQRFEKLDVEDEDYNKRKIALFSSLPYHKIDSVPLKDLEVLSQTIDEAINTEVEFTPVFEFEGKKYGFIPNFDELLTNEWVDLQKYGVESETLHNLMAILFRPITKELIGTYEIEGYNGTLQRSKVMKNLPMNIVNGALVFFYSLSNELENYILRYTKVSRARGK